MLISDWSSDVCSSDLCFLYQTRAESDWRTRWHRPDTHGAAPRTVSPVARSHRTDSAGRPAHAASLDSAAGKRRSEERRVGKECVGTWSTRWSPSPINKKHRLQDNMSTTRIAKH